MVDPSNNYVEIHVPTLLGIPGWDLGGMPGQDWKNGDVILWWNNERKGVVINQQVETFIEALEIQRNDPRGNITLLNSLLRDVTGEWDDGLEFSPQGLTFDAGLETMRTRNYRSKDYNKDMEYLENWIDNDFNWYFRQTGLTLEIDRSEGEYANQEKRELVLKRDGEILLRAKYSHEIISYLAKSDGITKNEMKWLTINGIDYQNRKLLEPIKEYEEKLKEDIAIDDTSIVKEFGDQIGISLGGSDNHLWTIGDLTVPDSVKNIHSLADWNTLKWYIEGKTNGKTLGEGGMTFYGFYKDVWDYGGAIITNRPVAMRGDENTDREDAEIAWEWLKTLEQTFNENQDTYKKTIYDRQYQNKMKTFIQNLKDEEDQIVMADFGVALHVDGDGNERLATEEEIQDDIQERLQIAGELLESNTSQLQNAVQELWDLGYEVNFSQAEQYKLEDGSIDYNKPFEIQSITYQEIAEPEKGNDVKAAISRVRDATKIYNDTKVEVQKEFEVLYAQEIERMEDAVTLEFLKSEEYTEMAYWENWRRRFGRGFDGLAHGIPVLFGNETAINAMKVHNKSAEFEKSYEWGEGNNWGAFGMVWADQGANMIMFMATLGGGTALSLGTKAALVTPSVYIGLTTGGQTKVKNITLKESAIDAEIMMTNLEEEYDKGFMSDEYYLKNKKRLNEIINAGDISSSQMFGSILSAIVIEGGFTYTFGLIGSGSLSTSKNILNAFNTSKKGLGGIMSYNPYTATGNVIKGATIGTAGEITEESLIYTSTEFIDSWIMQREGDYSQISKVIIDAAVMSSSSNVTSLTANTVLNHNMRTNTRRKFEENLEEINQLKDDVADIDLAILSTADPNKKIELRELRKAANDRLMVKEMQNFVNWQNFHIQVLGMSAENQKAIYENERLLNNYYISAGIKQKDANNRSHVESMLELHKEKLNREEPGSGDKWLKSYNEIQKSNEDLKGDFDMETAAKAIYGPDYKEDGSRKEIQNRIKKDKSKDGKKLAEEWGKADEENKLRIELNFIEKSYLEDARKEMEQNEGVKYTVEVNAYSEEAYEINGKKYDTKKDFITALKKLKKDGKIDGSKITVWNGEQSGILVENILSQDAENDVTVEENNLDENDNIIIVEEETVVEPEVVKEEVVKEEVVEEEVVEEEVVEEVVIDEKGEVKPIEEVEVKEKPKVTIVKNTKHQTKEQWEEKNKNKINYKVEKLKRENNEQEYYNYLARTHYAGGKIDLNTFQEGKITAKKLADLVAEETGKKLEFDDVGSVDGLLKKVQELRAEKRITDNEAKKLKEHIESNRKAIESNHNGFILDNTFFVINEKQAKERIAGELKGEGINADGQSSFLQGAAWMHETGHYLDNITKSIEEISQKGIYLNEFLLNDKSERAQILNEAVEQDFKRMSDSGGYYLKPRETISGIINERFDILNEIQKTQFETKEQQRRIARIDHVLDEYIRSVTDKMKHENFAKLRKDVTKRGRKTPFWRKSKEGDFTINNAQEAAFEVVSFIDSFKKGRLSESYAAQIKAAKGRKDLAGDVRSGMQESVTPGGKTIEQSINDLVRNADGSLMTKEEYDTLLNEGVQTKRRRDKKTKEWVVTKQPHPASLLTSDPSLPGNDWLNGSIRNLGTRMEGAYISLVKDERDSMNDFIQAVKDELTTAITNYNPETKYKGVAEGDLSGWLAQHILYKKPGVIDDFRKLQETRKAAKEGIIYKRDDIVDIETVEGTIVFARKLGFIEDVIGQDENGNNITRNVFDLIVEEKFDEVLAQDPKTYKDTKSLVKAEDAVLVEILNIVAKEFGIKPSKLIKDAGLTTGERTSIQLKINSIGARSMLNMMPEAFNSLGDANGVQPVFLDGKKGKAINSETGETNLIYTAQEERLKVVKQRVGNKIVYGKPKKKGGGKGLKIQKKNFVDNINEVDYLDMLGITPVGTERRFRTEDRVVDGPLRGSVMQVVTIIANQSVTKIAEEKGLVGLQSMKDGKGDLMLSSIVDKSGLDLIQHTYWDGRNKFHNEIDKVQLELNINKPKELKQQIKTAFESVWPYGDVVNADGTDVWIGDDGVNYKTKLINWYSKTLLDKYTKYTEKSVVIEGQNINSFLDFLMAEDAPRDDIGGTIAQLMEVESITPWIEDETNRKDQRKFNRSTVAPYIEKIRKRYDGKSKIKNEDGSLKYPKLTEEQILEKVFKDFWSFRGFLNNGYQGLRGAQSIFKNNDFYTENFLTQIYPNLDKVTKVRGKNKVKLTFKNGKTRTIETLQEYAQKVTKEMIATRNEDGTIDSPMSESERDGRKQLSDEAIIFTDDMFAVSANVAKSKTNKFNKMNFAVFAAQMNSHPSVSLRTGAVFTWAALDPPTTALNIDGERQFEFEHGMAARVVNAMLVMKHWFGHDISLKDIKKAYEVGALHVDFNANVSRLFG